MATKKYTSSSKPVIGIIGGRGKMGEYFAKLFTETGHKVFVSDHRTKLTNEQLIKKSDIIIISVPIGKTADVIKKIVHLIKPHQTLTDFTSLKVFPLKEMEKANGDVFGLHPMFSHTNSLPGQTIIACFPKGRKKAASPGFQYLNKLFTQKGAKIIEISPEKHDQIMAIVQALVHFSDIAFGKTLQELKIPLKEYLAFAGPASELKLAFVARLLAQDPDLYAQIQLQNPYAEPILSSYQKRLQELLVINTQHDEKKFHQYFQKAASHLKSYTTEALQDTNSVIFSLLQNRRQRSYKKNDQAELNVALAALGPKQTNTDLAAEKYRTLCAIKGEKTLFGSIKEVFQAVTNGHAKQGIIPIENLLQGTIRETYDELFTQQVKVVMQISQKITYALVAMPGVRIKEITSIASHEQALNQCSTFLKKQLPSAFHESSASTMTAYERMVGQSNRTQAVIVPLEVAKKLQLNILKKDIQNHHENKTTFIVIEKSKNSTPQLEKLAKKAHESIIAFTFHKDRPGTLYEIFGLFSENKINLTKIESRPSKTDLGNHIFFLHFQGKADEPKAQKVLTQMKQKTAKLKIFGSFPIL